MVKRRAGGGRAAVLACGVFLWIVPAQAWDEEGHVIVTRLAIRGLPATMPAWVRSPATESRLAYLSAEPDRWRGQDNVHLNHVNNPEHFMDEELLHAYGLTFANLPPLRREFTDHLATERALHPEKFEAYDRSRDADYTRRVPGLLPYAVAELQWKLAASWSTLKTYEKNRELVSDETIKHARDNVVFHMGILSHFVGDGAQPLHTTIHYNGWSGANPKGYTTSRQFHRRIDGGVLERHGITRDSLLGRARQARRVSTKDYWRDICEYLQDSFEQVEPLYALEKSGELDGPAGKRFIEDRLLAGGSTLAGVWAAAYEGAGIDDFLEAKLRRKAARAASSTQPADGAEGRP